MNEPDALLLTVAIDDLRCDLWAAPHATGCLCALADQIDAALDARQSEIATLTEQLRESQRQGVMAELRAAQNEARYLQHCGVEASRQLEHNAQIATLTATYTRLSEALERYGRHTPPCAVGTKCVGPAPCRCQITCSCGLTAALSEVTRLSGEDQI